jgi:Protein of unknown function (DUF2971)
MGDLEFDFGRFLLLREKDVESANVYKNVFIPDIIYKYYPLLDGRYSRFKTNNYQRLNTLQNEEIYVSRIDKLNDPFEFDTLTIDKEKIKKNKYCLQDIKKTLQKIKSQYKICCFCNSTVNNPLWAHYANNHHGFCVEYSVIEKDKIFPVQYIHQRYPVGTIPIVIEEICKGKLPNKKTQRVFDIFWSTFFMKHDTWKYENEFRFIYQDKNPRMGLTISNYQIGVKINKIIIGINCSQIYKKKLIDIATHNNCGVFQSFYDPFSENFNIQIKQITY